MGARSPPEGYRVAAARYGFPVRKRGRRAAIGLVGALAIGGLLLAACGATGSKSSGSNHSAACAFVAKLDNIAQDVARADVHDPAAFKKTLDTAVHDYVTNVQGLRAVAPTDLRASLDRVESDVQQYRFSAAVTDRAALDAYAARTCGRVPPGASSTTVPGSAGTQPTVSSTAPESTTIAG
jgi:hypothetical protein